MDRENDIKLIAYQIWEEEGCPDGRDCQHWIIAETIWEKKNGKKAAAPRKQAATAAVKSAKKATTSAKKSSKK